MNLTRKVNIIGDIDESTYAKFVEELDGLNEIQEDDDLTIELSSHGGDAMVALAFHDRIRQIKGDVTIHGFGIIASAAVIILAAGDRRIMSKNSWAMVHEDTVPTEEDARVSSVERSAATSRRLEKQWNALLAARTSTTAQEWEYLHMNESHLDAKTCLKLGLIDEIE